MKRSFLIATLSFVVATPFASAFAQETEEDSYELTLQQAYQKEFAFLAGQKRQLERRIGDAEKRSNAQASALEAEIARLESRLLSVEESLQTSREQLQSAETDAQTADDEQSLIGATIEQASTSLEDYGVELDMPEESVPSPETITKTFRSAVTTLERLSSVRTEKGSFYLSEGAKTEGDIIRVGNIASFGISAQGSGALAPAGSGSLKIWREPAADSAKTLASGKSPTPLRVFLYESIDTAVDEEGEETVVQHIDAGGAIAWVIMGLGAFGILLALVRALILIFSSGNNEKVVSDLSPLVRAGRYKEAAAQANGMKGSAARVANALFANLAKGSEKLDEALSESMLGETRRLQRFGAVILIIAAVSPLLGLLGTVTGMISTFDVITKFGTGDPKMLSGGISTALITTELGLVVAIPTLLLGNVLKGWADGIESKAEQSALKLMTEVAPEDGGLTADEPLS